MVALFVGYSSGQPYQIPYFLQGLLWIGRGRPASATTQFQLSLQLVEGEDTEGRAHFGREIESLMDIFGIDSSDGLLADYLGGV